MLLQLAGQFNDLSPKLRKELEEKIASFGSRVRYKFDISNPNPDPEKKNGNVIWPNVWTLHPTIVKFNDPYEDRAGKSKAKQVALVLETDIEKGFPTKFKKIRVEGNNMGFLEIVLKDKEGIEDQEAIETAMYLELHPNIGNGKFSKEGNPYRFVRIDEVQYAASSKSTRDEKRKALNIVADMTDAAIKEFADAMEWDSVEKPDILRNMVEEYAENDPIAFNKMASGEMVKYQSIIKQAIDKKKIAFDPNERKFTFAGTNKPIMQFNEVDDKTPNQQLAEWLVAGGKKEVDVYNEIKTLVGK